VVAVGSLHTSTESDTAQTSEHQRPSTTSTAKPWCPYATQQHTAQPNHQQLVDAAQYHQHKHPPEAQGSRRSPHSSTLPHHTLQVLNPNPSSRLP
jgi:hypothetical protein